MNKELAQPAWNHREHLRLRPPEGTIAGLRPLGEKLGLVRDIGRGGLAFEYLLHHAPGDTDAPEKCNGEIDIYWPEKKTRIPKIPCTVVWEKVAPADEQYSISSLLFCRVGVRFDDLNPSETGLIEELLAECQTVESH